MSRECLHGWSARGGFAGSPWKATLNAFTILTYILAAFSTSAFSTMSGSELIIWFLIFKRLLQRLHHALYTRASTVANSNMWRRGSIRQALAVALVPLHESRIIPPGIVICLEMCCLATTAFCYSRGMGRRPEFESALHMEKTVSKRDT